MQGHFVVTDHFVTICEVFVVPSCDTKFFSVHCFFTNSGKKTEKESLNDKNDKKEKKDKKDADSTVALETGKDLMYSYVFIFVYICAVF